MAEDGVLVDDAVRAQSLAGELRALPGDPDVVALRHGDVVRLHGLLVLHLPELPREELALRDLGDHPGEPLLDELVRRDRPVLPLLATLRVLERRAVGRHRAAERAPRDAVARLGQAGERALEALDAGEDVRRRDAAVLEGE